jgi:hypothetical protein
MQRCQVQRTLGSRVGSDAGLHEGRASGSSSLDASRPKAREEARKEHIAPRTIDRGDNDAHGPANEEHHAENPRDDASCASQLHSRCRDRHRSLGCYLTPQLGCGTERPGAAMCNGTDGPQPTTMTPSAPSAATYVRQQGQHALNGGRAP